MVGAAAAGPVAVVRGLRGRLRRRGLPSLWGARTPGVGAGAAGGLLRGLPGAVVVEPPPRGAHHLVLRSGRGRAQAAGCGRQPEAPYQVARGTAGEQHGVALGQAPIDQEPDVLAHRVVVDR